MNTFNSHNPKARRGQGKVDFFALQNHFQREINAGHTLTNIYANSASKLSIGYTQFTKYVSRYCMRPDYKQITVSHRQNITMSPVLFL